MLLVVLKQDMYFFVISQGVPPLADFLPAGDPHCSYLKTLVLVVNVLNVFPAVEFERMHYSADGLLVNHSS